jgi:hypothetical protein
LLTLRSGVVASLCLLAPCEVACSSSASDSGTPLGSGGAPSADGGAHPAGATPRFEDASLTVPPGGVRKVTVRVDPPGNYTVRFALVGDSRDAYLNASEVTTSPSGAATVELTAPSSPATFALRASVGAASATLPVSADGTANQGTTLNVVPLYAGHRTVPSWVATAQTGSHCDAVAGVLPPDGPYRGESSATTSPRIEGVPIDTNLTVTVRAGHFAGGCIELSSVAADRPTTVTVTVTDRPLQLGGVTLPVSLGIDATDAWNGAWGALSASVADAFVSRKTNDAAALLDAMLVATPRSSQGAFVAQRALLGWDAALGKALETSLGPAPLRSLVERWTVAGAASLSSGALVGTLTAPATPSGRASLEIVSVAGYAPDGVGFAAPGSATLDVSWTSASDDRVLFGGTASWAPLRLATALALGPAMAEVASAKTVAEALASTLSCDDVAATLVGDATVAFGTCDASCVVSGCGRALAAMWEAARNGTADAARVDFAASASATLDDEAKPLRFAGRWVGTARLGPGPARVGGTALGGTAVKRPP